MPPVVAAAAIVAAASAGSAVYTSNQQKKAQEEALKAQAEAQKRQLEYQAKAGEYYKELNEQQMILQARENQLYLLSDLIKTSRQQQTQQVFTLPPAQEQQPANIMDQINQSIDKLFRG